MIIQKVQRSISAMVTLALVIHSCMPKQTEKPTQHASGAYLVVLGVAQDAGIPQVGCSKSCCVKGSKKMVASLGLYDASTGSSWIFDATPDLPDQWKRLTELTGSSSSFKPDGIFLTHAHVGHYSGLMYLGLEAAHTSQVKVYAMPRMMDFILSNGPWSQLVKLKNILPTSIHSNELILVSPSIQVNPLQVPHRDEFSETVGYEISGIKRSALFLPDINKWSEWEINLSDMVMKHDYLFLDGTFFSGDELPGRDISKVPHPFVLETMEILKSLPVELKERVYFIHLNHTNPLLQENSQALQLLKQNGFKVAEEGLRFSLD